MMAAASLGAAQIDEVIVRQQWPWSTDVKVEYKISGVTSPVNVGVKVYDGEEELVSDGLSKSLTGDIYGISKDGVGTILIDPIKAFGTTRKVIANFKVELVLSGSAANINEVLYKVYNLESGECEDVTRAQLLNGKKGTVETDYTKLGDGFTTPVSDVVIWTGVTNDTKYATTHLVMRKIPAKKQTFAMGSPGSETGRINTDKSKVDGVTNTISGRETQHEVTLTNDFYMGVFEITQYQYWKIMGAWPSRWRLEECRDMRPVENVSYDNIRGADSTVGGTWPVDTSHAVLATSFLGKLQTALALSGSPKFDLPTEAQWEYACRAKCTKAWYNGYDCPGISYTEKASKLAAIARFNMNGGYVTNAYPQAGHFVALGTTNGTARVGSYAPNAWGLYDMLGNVQEWCLDWYGMFTEGAETDPVGPLKADAPPSEFGFKNRVIRGGCCTSRASDTRSAVRSHNTWSSSDGNTGLRLCLTIEE